MDSPNPSPQARPACSGLLELRVLGSLALAGPHGEKLEVVLRQPKRLALLVYLAVASPRGFHRRDTLVALFWPERDAEHARAALSHSLYSLRRAVGDGVIVSRGDEEVGLRADCCWCDAVTFGQAVDAGRLTEALSLYQGDLLTGFHVSDAPDFERWLETTQSRLRDRATQAAWMLADENDANGLLAGAIQWARRAVGLSPYNEGGLRRLMVLLDRAGDRAEAVYAYEQFTQRLALDLELRPSPETVALVEAIRERQATLPSSKKASSETVRPDHSGDQAAAPTLPTPPPQAALRRRQWPRVLPYLLVITAIGLLVGVARQLQPGPKPLTSPTSIAVLPFAYRGDPSFSYLAEGMVELLSIKLDGAAGIRTVEPRALLRSMSRDTATIDPSRGRVIAERFGAGLFVLGSIIEAGGSLQVVGRVYDTRERMRSSIEAMARGEAEIFDVADQVARQVLGEMQDTVVGLARVAGQTTFSLPALKAYLAGERHLRAGRLASAIEAFQEAAELDSTFALAHYRLATTSRDGSQAREALARALRHGDRLGPRHRGLIEASAAYFRGDHTTADQRSKRILTLYPNDSEAWAIQAALTLFKGHLLGRAWIDAREALERTVALDPQEVGNLWWLAAIAAREGRIGDLDSLTDRFLALGADPWSMSNARGLRAIVLGDTIEEGRFLADLRMRPDPWAQSSAGVITWATGDLSAGRRLWRLIAEPSRSPGYRVMARVTLAKIELTNGRRRAAKAELNAVETLDFGSALEHRALFALPRFLSVPPAELVALRDSLQRWRPAAGMGGDGLLAMHRGVHPYLRLYLLGVLNARLGEVAAALRQAVELERASSASLVGAFAADQGRIVRAEVAWKRGQQLEALRVLESARFWTDASGLEESGDSPFYSHLNERFARAELLYELGRSEEAVPWYRALTYDLLYTAPAHLRLAQIYERRGEGQKAIDHYSRLVDLWQESDPELQPMLVQAHQALARLR